MRSTTKNRCFSRKKTETHNSGWQITSFTALIKIRRESTTIVLHRPHLQHLPANAPLKTLSLRCGKLLVSTALWKTVIEYFLSRLLHCIYCLHCRRVRQENSIKLKLKDKSIHLFLRAVSVQGGACKVDDARFTSNKIIEQKKKTNNINCQSGKSVEKEFHPPKEFTCIFVGTLLSSPKLAYISCPPVIDWRPHAAVRRLPSTSTPCFNPYLANKFCLLSGSCPQTFRSLAAQLTSDEEPPSRTRHAKSIPGEARVAAGVRLAHVGESQRPVGGERDPVGKVIIHHPLTQMLFSIIIRAVMMLYFRLRYHNDV